jgi:hypothetical protein
VIDAGFDPKMYSLTLGDTPYEIKTWTPSRVTAIREHPCGTALMSIDVKAQGGHHCHCAARGLGRLHGGSADRLDVGRRNADCMEALRGHDQSSPRADV